MNSYLLPIQVLDLGNYSGVFIFIYQRELLHRYEVAFVGFVAFGRVGWEGACFAGSFFFFFLLFFAILVFLVARLGLDVECCIL